MRAMVLKAARTPLQLEDVPEPRPEPGQVLLRVRSCAVCRTDLHIVDGELARPKLPLVLGHEIVGNVLEPSATYRTLQKAGDAERIGIYGFGAAAHIIAQVAMP